MKKGRAAGLAVIVVLLCGLLGGCGGPIGAIVDTQNGLVNDGFQSVHVGIATPNSINVSVTVDAAPALSDENMVASVVWNEFHERFDHCNITVHGDGTSIKEQLSFADMQNQFGPRNPSWNRNTIRGSFTEFGAIILGGIAAVVVAIVVLVIVLQRRRRRRNPPWSPYPGQPWTGYQQQPPPYPGYQAPPPSYPGYQAPQYPRPDQYTQAPHPAQDQWAPPGQGPPPDDVPRNGPG